MVNNVTTIMCDVVPLWSGYIWGAQGGVTWDVCGLFLVTVPPFLALYFGLLYLQTSLQFENNIVERFDTKVQSFNSRVENLILRLRSKDFKRKISRMAEGVASTFNQIPIPRISFDEVDARSEETWDSRKHLDGTKSSFVERKLLVKKD